MQFHVQASWGPEAEIWVAESEDLPGLVAEAETVEALIEKLETLVPELAELNLGLAQGTFTLLAIKSRRTANGVLKQAGLPKKFWARAPTPQFPTGSAPRL